METHPLFMDEEDVDIAEKEGNETLDAIKVLRNSQTPLERAGAAKDDGNSFYRLALVNKKKARRDNLELAVNAYTEALDHAKAAASAMKGKDLRELSVLQSTIL